MLQFDEHAVGARRVNERDTRSTNTDTGRLVDELDTVFPKPLQRRGEIVNRQRDVMKAWPTPIQKSGDRRGRVGGLEELQRSATGGDLGNANPLTSNRLCGRDLQP